MKIFRSSYIILYDAITLIHMPQFVKPVFGYIYFCICSILYREQLITNKYKQNYLNKCCVFRIKEDMTEWEIRESMLWELGKWYFILDPETCLWIQIQEYYFYFILLNREEIRLKILSPFSCIKPFQDLA